MTSQRLIQEAKNFLRSGTPIPDEAVRPEILRSWKRCWGSHVPMEHGNKEILPLDAVEERIARRNSLCQVAFPYLDGLYDFIRGSEFLLLFSDEEGYILYARGDEDISRTARENGLVKGACRSESRLGTNGIGTVLVDRIPLQVFGAEHYYEVHANWACSGASVFLPDGDIGGVVCLSGMAEHVNDHTLGMVVAAADAISRQLKLKDAYDQLSKSYRNLSAIIETVPTAMCLLDESLHVVAFNTQATRQLALAPAELSGADFLEVLGCGADAPRGPADRHQAHGGRRGGHGGGRGHRHPLHLRLRHAGGGGDHRLRHRRAHRGRGVGAPPPYMKGGRLMRTLPITVAADADYPLPGLLTLPDGAGPFPAVLLVHGSGPQDRDEAV